jgi:hypothetical protein
MFKRQFRVLYREFLFRMVDLEVLSAHALGDANKLLGQFAALLVFISNLLSIAAFGFAGSHMAPVARLAFTMVIEHFLIATTMLVVGLFAVLSWDSTFPDRRDVLVLAPLPVRARTMFLAKVAAVATSLSLTVVLLHGASGLIWPLAFSIQATPQMLPAFTLDATPATISLQFVLVPASSGFSGLLRWFAAYWFTMLASGAFIYCGVLCVQGLAAQVLPRRLFLRVSGILQLGAFCLFVCGYFLQPVFGGLDSLTAPEIRRLLFWVPSYWFLGLFHELNGSMHPALAPLARQAWIGLAVVLCGTAVAYTLSYLHTLRRIVEEPDITPGLHRVSWLPRFGNRMQTAIGQFTVRTLARSRQHRMILAFYLGIGFALTIFLLRTPEMRPTVPVAASDQPEANTPLLAASIMMMALAVVGMRVVFALPLELRANWVFRITGVAAGQETLAAGRRSLLLLSVAPVWMGSAVLCLRQWPWRQAAGHLAILGLIGIILADLCLHGFRKIPFTCSYLPGKSQVHMVFLGALGLLWGVMLSVKVERQALQASRSTAWMVALFGLAACGVRLGTAALARLDVDELRFEEAPAPAVLELGLHRDGVMPIGPPDAPE